MGAQRSFYRCFLFLPGFIQSSQVRRSASAPPSTRATNPPPPPRGPATPPLATPPRHRGAPQTLYLFLGSLVVPGLPEAGLEPAYPATWVLRFVFPRGPKVHTCPPGRKTVTGSRYKHERRRRAGAPISSKESSNSSLTVPEESEGFRALTSRPPDPTQGSPCT